MGQSAIGVAGGYGGAVDGGHTQVLLVDLGGVLFSFDHEHRLNVLGECLGLPPGRVDDGDLFAFLAGKIVSPGLIVDRDRVLALLHHLAQHGIGVEHVWRRLINGESGTAASP